MIGRRVALAVALLVSGACRSPSTEGGASETGAPPASSSTTEPAATGDWVQLDDLPIPGRAMAVTFWLDGEVVVVGGDTFTCPDNASCIAGAGSSFADGAALDPVAGTWRSIPDAPVPFSGASVAVIGSDAYLLTYPGPYEGSPGPAFLRWSADDETWTELPMPSEDGQWYSVRAAGDVVVALTGSDEAGFERDLVFDPAVGEWAPLPDDPFPASFDRSAVWSDPHLYLFAKRIDRVSGSEPAVLQVARLDIATGTWEQLPDSDRIGYGPWLAEDGEITSPDLGSADGGEVNPWDRAYQNGGTYDIDAGTWSDLPAPPGGDQPTAGVVGAEGAIWYHQEGIALDVTTDAWFEVPAIPGLDDGRPLVTAAGRDAVAVAGYRWAGRGQSDAEMLTETWIWRPPAT